MKIDYEYICTSIANMCGIPIRLYQNGKLTFYYSIHVLPKDPILACLDKVLEVNAHVGYLTADNFDFYGIINSGDKKIVIGPTRNTAASRQELCELAFNIDLPSEDMENFIFGMNSIVRMPLESLIQVLCTVNYVLNGEKYELKDVVIYDNVQIDLNKEASKFSSSDKSENSGFEELELHNTYSLEQNLLSMIRRGDLVSLNKWMSTAPAVRGGILAGNQLRQVRNMFIVSVTLASRAAIQGGMDVEDALCLSDTFIQKCETLSNTDRISNLQYHMIINFTEHVNRVRIGTTPTKLSLDVSNCIEHHMSEPITAEQIAKSLFISRPYLSKKFKQETGMTITDYILKQKTEEAKRLLRYSDKSLSAIGSYLGFSSQSHFSRVFAKYAEATPGEYRQKHIK